MRLPPSDPVSLALARCRAELEAIAARGDPDEIRQAEFALGDVALEADINRKASRRRPAVAGLVDSFRLLQGGDK